MDNSLLRNLSYECLINLSTEEGINASGKDEIYGCIFGRDSAITILKILRVHSKKPVLPLLEIARRSLLTLVSLQGKEFNFESGEEPGKFIHEFRKDRYDHLLKWEKPWFVYPDGILRNYDSIDSTPLALIAIYKYYQITQDSEFFITALPAVELGLNWIITFGDRDKDSLLEYELPESRKFGGLPVQSWTDSHNSLRNKKGKMPKYPIAPVEAQGYAWLALKLWGDYFADYSPEFSRKLSDRADEMKKRFNEFFIFKNQGLHFAAQALDGEKNKIKTLTGNPLLLLWASYFESGKVESILDNDFILDLVKRSFKGDMFDKDAGIRTMSTKSNTFDPTQNSYQNGSFWPVLNGLIHEGLENWGLKEEANKLREASLKALTYFGSPIELYIKGEDGSYLEFLSAENGQKSCREQAWSAAATLDLLS